MRLPRSSKIRPVRSEASLIRRWPRAWAREASPRWTASIFRYFGTKDRIVIWDEADEGQVARLLGEIAAGSLAVALAARPRRRSPTFAERAVGRAAAGLMSAAIEEWSRRGGRVKLARLVAEAVEAMKAAHDEGADA